MISVGNIARNIFEKDHSLIPLASKRKWGVSEISIIISTYAYVVNLSIKMRRGRVNVVYVEPLMNFKLFLPMQIIKLLGYP